MRSTLNCAIYTRVSTDNQAEKEFNSCESQNERIKSFIHSQENMTLYDIYSDQGYSGSTLKRPSFQKLLQDISKGAIDCILTYKIDRLTRSPKDFYFLVELFDKYNVDFISVTERFDTSSPSGRLLRNIMLTFAQFEREMTSERTKDKMLERAKKGLWNGGPAPFGYNRKDKKLVINRKDAKSIQFLFDTFIQTKSLAETYDIVRRKNILNKKGNILSKSHLVYIIQNLLYLGKIKYKNEVYEGLHDPIISLDQFNMAQKVFKAKKKRITLTKAFLFTGLIKCDDCGSSMTPCFVNKNIRKRYYYYRCVSTFKHSWDSCNLKQINADKLEDYVIDKLTEISKDNNYVENWIFRLNHTYRTGHHSGLELSKEKLLLDPKGVQEHLGKFLETLEKLSEIDKISWVKEHIKKIVYAKNEIRVTLYSPTPCAQKQDKERSVSCPHSTNAFQSSSSPQKKRTQQVPDGFVSNDWLGCLDSNQKRMIQSHLCYQLHHIPAFISIISIFVFLVALVCSLLYPKVSRGQPQNTHVSKYLLILIFSSIQYLYPGFLCLWEPFLTLLQ